MPVHDIEVQEKSKRVNAVAWCNNKSRTRGSYVVSVRLFNETGDFYGFGTERIYNGMSKLCRQVGEYINGGWRELAECKDCPPDLKDHEYINRMRSLQEQEVRSSKLHL